MEEFFQVGEGEQCEKDEPDFGQRDFEVHGGGFAEFYEREIREKEGSGEDENKIFIQFFHQRRPLVLI